MLKMKLTGENCPYLSDVERTIKTAPVNAEIVDDGYQINTEDEIVELLTATLEIIKDVKVLDDTTMEMHFIRRDGKEDVVYAALTGDEDTAKTIVQEFNEVAQSISMMNMIKNLGFDEMM